jgi:hypothetical protein
LGWEFIEAVYFKGVYFKDKTMLQTLSNRRAPMPAAISAVTIPAVTLLRLFLLLFVACLSGVLPSYAAVTGNIGTAAIEIDTNANLYPANGAFNPTGFVNGSIKNSGATSDWVKDANANTDSASLSNSIATGIIPGVSGATGGKGHWNGVRIVDGIAGNDNNIFLTGGKENDVSTWNIGPGTTGSSKYDISQAYLANNRQTLFFGMERLGNNGTTAFDFEFNQLAPKAGAPLFPNRSVGDVLFTFEMSGSGSSGSAVPHYYTWNGTKYIERTPPPSSLISSINNVETPSAPWGYVNERNEWVVGTIPRFQFAEAAVNLAQAFPNFTACNNRAFVQVRTRASAVDTSDLKDTTEIFEFFFGGPKAAGELGTDCEQSFTYDASASRDSSGSTALTYQWAFKASAGVTLSGTGLTGPDASGFYRSTAKSGAVAVNLPSGVNSASITASLSAIEGAGCSATATNLSVTVYRVLSATATLATQCNLTITYTGTASGGKAPYAYSWQFQKNSANDGSGTWSNVGTSTTASGSLTVATAGAYRGILIVTDTADSAANGKPQCEAEAVSPTINVYPAVGGSVRLSPDCDDTFTYSASGSGGVAPYTFAWTIQKLVNGAWVTAKTFTAGPAASSTGTLDVDDFAVGANGDGRYRATVLITDSQSPGCDKQLVSNVIDVKHGLVVTAKKTSANGNTLTVTLTATSETGATFQWQKLVGGTWTDIAGATASTVAYSSFEADVTPTATSFTLGADNYVGKLYTVQIRVKAKRTLNGVVCEAISAPEAVKKVIAVDP